MQAHSASRSLSSRPDGDSISNNGTNISTAPRVQHGKSLYTTILSQNYRHAHNSHYKSYAQIMNDAESFKPLKPGEKHVHFEDKPSPWLHPNPNNSHHPAKPTSPRLHPKSRV
ncbi:MAG: hypothetical protein ACOYK6_07315 [Chthoniobacterales bacterium]